MSKNNYHLRSHYFSLCDFQGSENTSGQLEEPTYLILNVNFYEMENLRKRYSMPILFDKQYFLMTNISTLTEQQSFS